MSIALTLLDDVRWRGIPVVGERPQALLAALAAGGCRPVGPAELIGLVWGDAAPSNGVKSLQVLVSRVRSACGADAIARDGAGYRLGVGPDEVDSAMLAGLVRRAASALDRDAAHAAGLAREALALAGGLARAADDEAGPLAEIRRAAAADTAAARVVLARAASRTGAHADALSELELAQAGAAHDESLLADLLRSEAAVRGPAVALERFERHRRDLRERLGADPGEPLQRVHRGLLALDRPVRRGVRYDATELIGRDRDLGRLRTLLAGARVVSVVGAGGLGKTRLAHVLAREAQEPAVYFVELAGVTSAEDVAVEVGSVLGVRDSVSSRRALTAEQRADIRARIARQLGQVPGLLVLDNCEHLIGAAAELVAFLVAATPDLRVLTTSRAPLAIAAERVYQLGELGSTDAVELFRERALAARPDVRLDERVVASIVGRLDGLPLAIELAAAKVRVMAVEEIDRRLEDRFALLRGGDRSAPDRHQALLTVIEWSWNLLDGIEQRALRRLALFHDGFTLDAAESVLGPDAVDAVRGLVDQSLVNVRETPAGVRYRMLETVREFGRMRLAAAGEQDAARAAQRQWAAAYASAKQSRVIGPEHDQFAAIDALSAEETNLADELRGAIADGDQDSLVQLLAALGTLWTMRGEHVRLLVLVNGVSDALRDWTPPPGLADTARAAVAVTLNNSLMISGGHSAPLLALLRRLGPATGSSDARLSALIRVLLTLDQAVDVFPARLAELADDPDRHTAALAGLWLSHQRENEGDPVGALDAARQALAFTADDADPWSKAMARTLLAELAMQLGDSTAAVAHAMVALPVMRRLGASDDETQLRALLVFCAIGGGRLAEAQEELDRIESIDVSATPFGAAAFRYICRAELLLASGDLEAGLRLYRECASRLREAELPGLMRTGTEPWSVFGDALALSAHAWYAAGADEAHARTLYSVCHAGALKVLAPGNENLDYPAAGLLLFALGAWSLLRQAAPPADALRLLALADRFAYNRMIPTMLWERIAPAADKALPGRLSELQAEYAGRRPPDLLAEAWRTARLLPAESER
ncbi:MAG TPA: BTAD domain-containing putative transcriptional regulator [Actinocrinis sp.]